MKQAKFTGFFKLVDADPTPVQIVDNVSFDNISIGNITGWYSNIVTGSGNRMSRYTEYDVMDSDVEVSRALDIIAEEMTNGKSDELLTVEILDESMSESEQVTLNVACKRWIRLLELDSKLFHIARNLIKYGDVVFRRDAVLGKWEYVQIKQVRGAYVDQNDASKVIGIVINQANKQAQNTPYNFNGTKQEELTVLPIQKVIRFTLNNDMSESAPFGQSVLSSIYKAFQQKRLIEDSIIIYRVQRAPERRVFYIDVGRMPPQRRKAYLEQVKLEMRQRKVPSFSGQDASTVDSIYDPQDMMEDFYIATGSESKGSKIEVLPGGQNLGDLKDLEYFSNKLSEGLRIPLGWYRSDQSQPVNDGKMGMAFIQELRFSKFVERLQLAMERTLDPEFKMFVKSVGIRIDPNSYNIRLPEPSNFGSYRQAEKDGAVLGVYGQVVDIKHMSPRFAMKRFLQMTENEIIENERLRREELNIAEDDPLLVPKLYNVDSEGGGGGFGGGGFGGSGGDFGLDDTPGDLDADADAKDLNPSGVADEETPPDIEETPPDRGI